MDSIGKMSLKNQGGFSCKIKFAYKDGDKEKTTHAGGPIALGQTDTADPADFDIADGTAIKMYVDVSGGKDNENDTWFMYQRDNSQTAHFVISGTTLDNSLGYIGTN